MLLADHADEAADPAAHRHRAHQRRKSVAPDGEFADRGIGTDRSDRSAPAPQRVGSGLDVGEQRLVGDREMAHLAGLVEPRSREASDLGETLDDLVRTRPTEREIHELQLQLLGSFVEEGALVEDEANAGVMRVRGVDPVGQPEQRHHQAVGCGDALDGHVADNRHGDPTLLRKADHDLGQIEALVEEADALDRHESDLAALDRLERGRTGAQRAGPLNPAFEAAAAAEQVGA